MNKKISIIVPVYNVERYVERCILSVVTQNVSTDDYELIVVNDGSTDSSREILATLQRQYPFIQIIDKENGGLSSARNAGLPHAKGGYVFFLDSDDWIAENSLAFLLKQIERYPVDILLFGIHEVDENGKEKGLFGSLSPNDVVLNVEDYLTSYTLRSSAWQGLFSRRFFDEKGYRFLDGFVSEDDDFVVHVFSRAKQIVCNNRQVYFYYQRSDSISKGKEFEQKMIQDKLIMLADLDDYIQSFHGKLKQGLQRKLDFLAVDIIRLLIRKNHTSEFIDESLQRLSEINYFPLREASYSLKYRIFRKMFSSPSKVKQARALNKYV
ncbi:MAG: glycosyltransferase family 2 protein [Dysgonomonas sp.]